MCIRFLQANLAELLWQFGEEELEARVRSGLSDEERWQIGREVGRMYERGERGSLPSALGKSAAFVLEGAPRELARKRRRTR
jgi:hypothetical protein